MSSVEIHVSNWMCRGFETIHSWSRIQPMGNGQILRIKIHVLGANVRANGSKYSFSSKNFTLFGSIFHLRALYYVKCECHYVLPHKKSNYVHTCGKINKLYFKPSKEQFNGSPLGWTSSVSFESKFLVQRSKRNRTNNILVNLLNIIEKMYFQK